MTEPPRPPGDGYPGSDPTSPYSPGSYSVPGDSPAPGFPPQGQPTPPQYDAPASGGGAYPPPTSGAGGYPQQGGGYPPQGGGYPQQGGYPPQGGGYPPQGGTYGQPAGGYGAPSPGYANSDEKTWAMIAHFGGIVVGFIAPLVAMLAKGNESPTVRAHAVEALNFQITWAVATLVAVILMVCSAGILFFLPFITWVVILVFSIMAGMKANEGVVYRYPVTVRLVK